MTVSERLAFRNYFWTGLLTAGLYTGLSSGGDDFEWRWYDWLWWMPLAMVLVAPIAALIAWLKVGQERRHPGKPDELNWRESVVLLAVLLGLPIGLVYVASII